MIIVNLRMARVVDSNNYTVRVAFLSIVTRSRFARSSDRANGRLDHRTLTPYEPPAVIKLIIDIDSANTSLLLSTSMTDGAPANAPSVG